MPAAWLGTTNEDVRRNGWMGDPFDPYREALIIETETVWPEDLGEISGERRAKIEAALHADPQQAGELAYVRLHTGFCRRITVTSDDLALAD